MNIVVMGGSFNPPTIAHLKIMLTALDSVNAEKGFMIPVSYPYLKRKMRKIGQSNLCLSNDLRVQALKATIASDSRIQVFVEAMNDPFSDDVGTMNLIQDRYPGAGVYYVAGADKLALLDGFAGKSDFFDRFRCILYARGDGGLDEEISRREHLAKYRDAFVRVDPPDGIDGVSSTRIRESLFDIDAVADMLHPDVVPLLRELRREDYPEEILQFKDEHAFLSNDFPAETSYEGVAYPCATSAFLASKIDDPSERKAISRTGLDKVKKRYGADPGSPEWEARKTDVMENVVRLKFQQHPELLAKLIATGNRKLINGGKKDEFWGVNLITWEGENRLGQILMKLRTEEKKS